jgi:hypothetical protein
MLMKLELSASEFVFDSSNWNVAQVENTLQVSVCVIHAETNRYDCSAMLRNAPRTCGCPWFRQQWKNVWGMMCLGEVGFFCFSFWFDRFTPNSTPSAPNVVIIRNGNWKHSRLRESLSFFEICGHTISKKYWAKDEVFFNFFDV